MYLSISLAIIGVALPTSLAKCICGDTVRILGEFVSCAERRWSETTKLINSALPNPCGCPQRSQCLRAAMKESEQIRRIVNTVVYGVSLVFDDRYTPVYQAPHHQRTGHPLRIHKAGGNPCDSTTFDQVIGDGDVAMMTWLGAWEGLTSINCINCQEAHRAFLEASNELKEALIKVEDAIDDCLESCRKPCGHSGECDCHHRHHYPYYAAGGFPGDYAHVARDQSLYSNNQEFNGYSNYQNSPGNYYQPPNFDYLRNAEQQWLPNYNDYHRHNRDGQSSLLQDEVKALD